MRRSEIGQPIVWIALATALAGCSDYGGNLGPYDGSAGVFVSPDGATLEPSPLEAGSGPQQNDSSDAGGQSSASSGEAGGEPAGPTQGSPGGSGTSGDATTGPTNGAGDDAGAPDTGVVAVDAGTGVPRDSGADGDAGSLMTITLDAQPEAAGADGSGSLETGAPDTTAPDTGGSDGAGSDAAADTGALDAGAHDSGTPDADATVADSGVRDADATAVDSGAGDAADAATIDAGNLCNPDTPGATTSKCIHQRDKSTTTDPTLVCSTCTVSNSCLDPVFSGKDCEAFGASTATLFSGTLFDGKTCTQVLGPAPVTETRACLAVLDAVFASQCAASLQETPCVCGTVPVGACTAGTANPNGPGFDLFACDFNSTTTSVINSVFTMPRFGAGAANSIIQCMAINNCDCF